MRENLYRNYAQRAGARKLIRAKIFDFTVSFISGAQRRWNESGCAKIFRFRAGRVRENLSARKFIRIRYISAKFHMFIPHVLCRFEHSTEVLHFHLNWISNKICGSPPLVIHEFFIRPQHVCLRYAIQLHRSAEFRRYGNILHHLVYVAYHVWSNSRNSFVVVLHLRGDKTDAVVRRYSTFVTSLVQADDIGEKTSPCWSVYREVCWPNIMMVVLWRNPGIRKFITHREYFY